MPRIPTIDLAAARSRLRRFSGSLQDAAKSPTTVGGAVVILAIVAMALFAPYIVAPNEPDPSQMPRDWAVADAPPGTPGHPLGTTANGGDVLYGIVWGARTSVVLALVVVSSTVVIGSLLGSIAGMSGGKVDEYIMRFVEVVQTVPELVLAMAIAGALGPSFRNIMLALIVANWTDYARIIRGEILKVKNLDYVEAAHAIGDKRWKIYLKDVLPNSLTPLIVLMTLDTGKVVLVGATLSFIGLAEAGLAEWGNLVAAGQSGILSGHWWAATFGGAMVFLWALAANLLGDGLRDVIDPKTETR